MHDQRRVQTKIIDDSLRKHMVRQRLEWRRDFLHSFHSFGLQQKFYYLLLSEHEVLHLNLLQLIQLVFMLPFHFSLHVKGVLDLSKLLLVSQTLHLVCIVWNIRTKMLRSLKLVLLLLLFPLIRPFIRF